MSDSVTPWTDRDWLETTRLLCPWDFPGKSTGVGCHSLLQGILPTQGSNLGLLHRRQTLHRLSHRGVHLPDTNAHLETGLHRRGGSLRTSENLRFPPKVTQPQRCRIRCRRCSCLRSNLPTEPWAELSREHGHVNNRQTP